jgi:hypothetical protein
MKPRAEPVVTRLPVTTKAFEPARPAANMLRTRAGVLQPVMAYRVGTGKSKYKVEIDEDKGTIKELKGGSSGIDISFDSRDHASYYFATKKGDAESVMDEWDFPDDLYKLLVYRMNNPAHKKCPDGGSQAIWDEIKNLPAPMNSSDKAVREGGLIAPHFQLAWIPVLNKYCKNKKVKRTTVAEEFPVVTPVVVVGAEPGENDDVEVYLPADAVNGEEIEGTMKYSEYRLNFRSGGYNWRTV